MPPTISPLFKLRLSALGEDLNSWGDPNLNNALKLIEEAVAGPLTLTITGSRTLTADNYISNEYRRGSHTLVAGGGLAAAFTITVPAVAYVYRITNKTAYPATFKTASGASAVVRAGMTSLVFCDGTDCTVADPTLDQIKTASAAVNLGGQQIQNAADGTAPGHLATVGQVPAVAATQVQLASDWAQKTTGTVDGTEYSAKLWATSTTVLTGGNKGAKGYALDAASSASAASGSASAANTSAGNAATSATNAATSATAADISAQASAAQATRLSGTSTTSNIVGTGSKTFTTQSGKFFDPGTRLLVSANADPANTTLFGVVTAYAGTSLTLAVTATTGSGTYADWTLRVSGERGAAGPAGANVIARSQRTSNTQLVSSDSGSLIDITSGSFTQTIAAAASLVSGWWVDIKNSGTGVIVLDPNGSETVDGLQTITVYPLETLTVQCDGTSFNTIGRLRTVPLGKTVVSASTGTIDFTTGLADPEMSLIQFEIDSLAVSSGGNIRVLFGIGGVFTASTYAFSQSNASTNGTVSSSVASAQASIIADQTALPIKHGTLRLSAMQQTASGAALLRSEIGGFAAFTQTMGARFDVGPVTAIRLTLSAGTFNSGTIKVYGSRSL